MTMTTLLSLCLSLMIFLSCSVAETQVHYNMQRMINDLHEKQKYMKHVQEGGHHALLDHIRPASSHLDGTKSLLERVLQGDFQRPDNQSINRNDNVSGACMTSTLQIFDGLLNNQSWALQMIDATAKIPTGVTEGNIKWLGSYSLCIKATAMSWPNKTMKTYHPVQLFKGRYCTAHVYVGGFVNLIPNAKGSIAADVCVPDTCDENDVKGLVNAGLFFLPPKYQAVFVTCQKENIPLDTPAVGVICMLAVLGAFIAAGTLYDILVHQRTVQKAVQTFLHGEGSADGMTKGAVIERLRVNQYAPLVTEQNETPETTQNLTEAVHNEQRAWQKLLLAGSVYSNAAKLLSTTSSGRDLRAVHGIRFLSMTWVILGHTFAFVFPFICWWVKVLLAGSLYSNAAKVLSTTSSGRELRAVHGVRFLSMTWVILGHTWGFCGQFLSNLMDFGEYLKRWTFQAILNATVSVDTFFVLSGLLMTYLVLTEMKKNNGRLNWALFYFHRFWRLTPPYMLVLGVHTALFKYWGSGAMWSPTGIEPFCSKYWWTNLLYINNIVDQKKMCMGWSWYLANDMQFFVISPLILIPLYKWPVVGYIIMGLLMLACWISTGVISTVNKYGIGLLQGGNSFNDLYIPPWTRIGPYLIGMLVGYILYKTERKVRLHWAVVVTGWMVAAASCLAVVYGLYDVEANGHAASIGVSALYNAVSRSAWGVGVGWVIFACVTGYGGWVNTLLSWPALIPLSRLTYMAYLVHPIVMYYFYLTRSKLFYVDDMQIIYLFLGHLFAAYMVAFAVSLVFEAPMMGLEKVVFPKKKPPPPKNTEAAQTSVAQPITPVPQPFSPQPSMAQPSV